MANYSILKAAVETVVKTNGNEEITGANLQSTLESMIDSLGADYQFAGVATISTAPGTPDENVCYIGGSGTYSNFGSTFIVPEGSIGLFKYNGSWSNSLIKLFNGIDNEPIQESNNLVKSGGVQEGFKTAYNSIYSPESLYSYTPTTGTINSSGEWVWNSSYKHIIIPLSGVEKVIFSMTSVYTGIIAFLKTYDTSSENADFADEYPSRIGVDVGESLIYNVPQDAAYLYILNSTSASSDLRPYQSLVLVKQKNSIEDIITQEMKTNIPRGFVIDKNKTISLDLSSEHPYVRVTDSETHDLVYMNIEDGVTKLIPVNGTAGRYRFFNTYNKIDYNSYIAATDITSGAVPPGAKYVAILFSHSSNPNGLDNLVIKKEPDVNEVANNIEKMLDNTSEQIDIADLPDFGFIIGPDNKYQSTAGATLARGRVVEIPNFSSYITIEAGSNTGVIFALLEDTVASAGAAPHFASGNEMRYTVPVGGTGRYKLNSSCNYLYFSKSTTGGTDMEPASVTVEYTMGNSGGGGDGGQKKELNILFIGSSGEQDMVAYVPPILKEVLYDYDVTVGDMYYSGAQAQNYVNFYQNDTPCQTFNLWSSESVSWSRSGGLLLEDALEITKWNLIIMKGTEEGCRQLMRIIQSLVSYPVAFATVANIPRDYTNPWENIIEATKNRCLTNGFVGWIPVGTGMQNARSSSALKMTGGITCPAPTLFTIPAGKFFAFQHRIRKSTASIEIATIKAQRTAGNGNVVIYAGDEIADEDYLLLTLSDGAEHTTTLDQNTEYIKIINNGSDSCTVTFENTQATGDYLLFTDNQHTQSGIPTLISAYTIVLKLLQWTGNADRGINASSFIPTSTNIISIGAANAGGYGNGLGHGYSCGVENYIGSDGNIYDRSQLTLFEDTLYVTTTVFDNTPDGNSISAALDTNNPINYLNIYAAQEVAMLSVNSPDVLTDCSNVVIEIPQKV